LKNCMIITWLNRVIKLYGFGENHSVVFRFIPALLNSAVQDGMSYSTG